VPNNSKALSPELLTDQCNGQFPVLTVRLFLTRSSEMIYKIVISNTFRRSKIDTKWHLVNIWSDHDLVKSCDWYINNNKKTWSVQIFFPKMFWHIDVYVQKHFWINNFLCALCFLVCAHLTTCVRARTA